MRMYLGVGWEAPPQQWSRDQVQSARDNGCKVVGYWWGYNEYPPEDSLERAVDLAANLAVPLDVPFYVDHERYPPAGAAWSIPNERWLERCGEHYAALGVASGLYGSAYMAGLAGWPQIAGYFQAYWYANYQRPPDDMSGDGGYGFTAEHVVCHQYGSTQAGHPCDVNRILSAYT